MPGPWEDYQVDKNPTPKEREGNANATTAEAQAPYAGRKAAASAELTEAQVRQANAAATLSESKAAAAAEKTNAEKADAVRQRAEKFETVEGYLGNIQRARDAISSKTATGPLGQITGGVWGSNAADLQGLLTSIANPVVLEAMAEARKGSAAGATGFGALSQKELDLLKGKFGSLSQSQGDESLLKTLDEIEQSYRRLLAYNAGYDPYTPEGALLVGLPAPEGSEPPLPTEGEIGAAGGKWIEDPELKGVDAAIISMIKAKRSAPQIRAWLNQYKPGLGDKVNGLEAGVQYYSKSGKEPDIRIGRYYQPAEPTIISKLADSPIGAGAIAASDQLMSGFTAELAAGEMSGSDYERTSAVMRGLREKYPVATFAGDLAGSVGATLAAAYGGAKAGLRLPSLLEGVGQEALYGFGSSEPGDRLNGALRNGAMAPITNIGGKFAGDLFGTVLKGASPEARALVEKYNINLTPGQMQDAAARERSIAGLPVVGPQVTARRNETLEQFNKAAFDDALKPLGVSTTSIGQKGIAEAQEAYRKAYREALDGVNLDITDPDFLPSIRGQSYADLAKLREIGPDITTQVDSVFAKYADPQTGVMAGDNLQNALQELQTIKQSYKSDPRWAKQIAPALDDIADGYAGLLERQAPENFQLFQRANEAYRNVSILERAVENAPNGDVFGPGNLRTATKLGTQKFGGKRASARGDRPFNELVMNALGVIPEKADDVSLAGRFVAPVAGASGAGTLAAGASLAQSDKPGAEDSNGVVPPWMLAATAGLGLASLPYSRRGNSILRGPLMGNRTDNQRMLGELVQQYGPAALRGVVRSYTTEPGAPMPQNFGYDQLLSPTLREAVRESAKNAQPLTPEEKGALDFRSPQYTNVDAAGNTIDAPAEGTMVIDGRAVQRDPDTGDMVFVDTGEPVPGFADGGRATLPSDNELTQAVRRTARAPAKRPTLPSDNELTQAVRRTARAPAKRPVAAKPAKRTSELDDLVMAASRRGNDVVASLADLADRYVKPADAAAWLAENIGGYSASDAAKIRQNLQGLGSMRQIVDAGAAENERRFAAAGGRGARTGDEVMPTTSLADAAYRPQDVPAAVISEAPRAAQAVGEYFGRSTPMSVLRDIGSAAQSGYEGFTRDPYGYGFDGALYATPAGVMAAAPFDYAAMRGASRSLDPYLSADPSLKRDKRMIDAFGVLPAAAAIPGVGRAARKRRGGLAVKRKSR